MSNQLKINDDSIILKASFTTQQAINVLEKFCNEISKLC